MVNTTANAVQAYSKVEDLSLALQSLQARSLVAAGEYGTLSAAQGEAAEQAQELLNWSRQLAIQSPLSQGVVTQSYALGASFQFNTEQAQRLTSALVDTAAGTAQSAEFMQGATLALGQTWVKGKLQGEEALQLIERGIPVWEYLATYYRNAGDAANYTTGELQDMASSGLIPAGDAVEAITQGLERDFAGAAARSGDTVSGLTSSLADVRAGLLAVAAAPIVEVLRPQISEMVATLQDPATLAAAEQFGANLAGGLSVAVAAVREINEGLQVVQAWTQTPMGKLLLETEIQMPSPLPDDYPGLIPWLNNQLDTVIPGYAEFDAQWQAAGEQRRQALSEWLGISTAIQAVEEDINSTDILSATVAAMHEVAAAFDEATSTASRKKPVILRAVVPYRQAE
jgi:tape measure domain-containing protein